ncbi:N-acetylmuramoyl-L-alanine amidase [Pseudomonas chlororaphis subsp. aurantiaca]|nr:N-acetylmuramoyl-L-alanine amidase [Pseudomonas chlororaphis subsp. aurantiaca]
MKVLVLALSLLLLAGCASGPRFDTSHPSVNFDERVQFVVVHYTSASMERSLQLLTHGQVSSHYLIGDDKAATIYKLVDEQYRAWHAGESQWQGRTWLNSSSIGIEIVNPGFRDLPTGRVWYPYSEAQVQSLIVLLKDISKRNNIAPQHIIGHSDIAPCASSTRARCSPGSVWPKPGWAAGRTPRRWRARRRSLPHSCRASPGSSKAWRVLVMRRRRPANWMWRPVTCWPRSRCITGRRVSTASRMRKALRSCRFSTRQNNDARPTVRAFSQSVAITHW